MEVFVVFLYFFLTEYRKKANVVYHTRYNIVVQQCLLSWAAFLIKDIDSADVICTGAVNNLEPDSFFSSLIDDVHIYNRAITP